MNIPKKIIVEDSKVLPNEKVLAEKVNEIITYLESLSINQKITAEDIEEANKRRGL